MTFCPKCLSEYFDDKEVCDNCNVDLINELPVPIPEEYADSDWVELFVFPGSLYARMAIELLQREGIPAYSQSDFIGSAYGVGGSAGYVGSTAIVYVLEPDYEHAREVISAMADELPDGITDTDEE